MRWLRFSAVHIPLLIPLNERKNSWGQTGSSQQVPGSGQSLLWLHGRYQNQGRSLAFLHSYIITQLKSFSKGQRQNFVSWKKKRLFVAEGLVLFGDVCLLNFWHSFSSPVTLSTVAAGIQLSSQVWTQNTTALRHQGCWASSQELPQDSRRRN